MTNRKNETDGANSDGYGLHADYIAISTTVLILKENYVKIKHSACYLDLQNIQTNSTTNLLSKALPRECRNLSRIVEHYGHDRRVIVTKNLKTHLLEF